MANIHGDVGNISSERAQNIWNNLKIFCGTLDRITVNPKYVQPYSITPIAKQFFAVNSFVRFIPTYRADDESFWDRLMLIPCVNQLPVDFPRNEDFVESLVKENRKFIFLFALDGLRRGLQEGWFKYKPSLVLEYLKKYRKFLSGIGVAREDIKDFLESDIWRSVSKKKLEVSGLTMTEIYTLYFNWASKLELEIRSRPEFRDQALNYHANNFRVLRRTSQAVYYKVTFR